MKGYINMNKNYEIVLRQCLEYAYTRLDIKEHTTEYIKHSDCLHFIFKLNDSDRIEFKIKTFEKVGNTLYDLEDIVLFNIFKQRLEKFISIKKSIYGTEMSIKELEKENENLCNKLNQNNERIIDLERILFDFKELRRGAMYE